MFNLYNDHHNTHFILPAVTTVDEAHEIAKASAELGHDALYRVFIQHPGEMEQFVCAFSVLDGKVTEHSEVTIPEAHWS